MSLLSLDDRQAKQLLSCHMVVSNGQIREIDISKPARALRFLRMTDYLLLILCSESLLRFLAGLFANPLETDELVFSLILGAGLVFLVYTGWRHVGVIDVGVWRAYLVAFPLLVLLGLLSGVVTIQNLPSMFPDKSQTMPGIVFLFALIPAFLMSAGAVGGLVSVLLLRTVWIATFEVSLMELLRDLSSRSRLEAVGVTKIKRVNVSYGTVLAVLGMIFVVVPHFVPLPLALTWYDQSLLGRLLVRSLQLSPPLGYFLLIRARRYFQFSADSLLSIDKRKPILFLRSFADDGRMNFWRPDKSLLDFSLEARLSNHFAGFGPFIAIGSPKDPVPQIGAARAILSDDAWQAKVLAWMSEASAVTMYSGKSQWVTWELAKLVDKERVAKLILMIPEVKGWRSAIRSKDIAARMEHVRDAFGNTKWRGALAALQNSQDVRAMLFRSDGSLVVIKSRPRNRDSYHLAALIAHYILLKETSAMLVGINEAVQDRQFPVDTEIFYIGAAEDNNLSIKDDDYISGHHALLRYERGKLSIADQHSKNGTFVNGNRLGDAPVTVNVGDQIRMGHSTFAVAHAENKNRARAA